MSTHPSIQREQVLSDIRDKLRPIFAALSGRELDQQLRHDLNDNFPPDSPEVASLAAALRSGFEQGAIGERPDESTVYQHVESPHEDTAGFSADAVILTNVKGGRHQHPRGEIDLVIPLDEEARFDGKGKGWLVYPPGSGHCPSVTGGSAIILFMLPGGEMMFE